jgi:hypothetical protein
MVIDGGGDSGLSYTRRSLLTTYAAFLLVVAFGLLISMVLLFLFLLDEKKYNYSRAKEKDATRVNLPVVLA